jgi:hypothetical protein
MNRGLAKDLKAARALYADGNPLAGAVVTASAIKDSDRSSEARLIRLCDALDAAAPTLPFQLNGRRRHAVYAELPSTTRGDLFALFDRAIAAEAQS